MLHVITVSYLLYYFIILQKLLASASASAYCTRICAQAHVCKYAGATVSMVLRCKCLFGFGLFDLRKIFYVSGKFECELSQLSEFAWLLLLVNLSFDDLVSKPENLNVSSLISCIVLMKDAVLGFDMIWGLVFELGMFDWGLFGFWIILVFLFSDCFLIAVRIGYCKNFIWRFICCWRCIGNPLQS